jgi:hypothetical protein
MVLVLRPVLVDASNCPLEDSVFTTVISRRWASLRRRGRYPCRWIPQFRTWRVIPCSTDPCAESYLPGLRLITVNVTSRSNVLSLGVA